MISSLFSAVRAEATCTTRSSKRTFCSCCCHPPHRRYSSREGGKWPRSSLPYRDDRSPTFESSMASRFCRSVPCASLLLFLIALLSLHANADEGVCVMRSEDGTCVDLASDNLASTQEADGGGSEILTDHAESDATQAAKKVEKEGDEASDESAEKVGEDEDDDYYDELGCYDETEHCAERALNNGCIRNFAEMREDCKETCLLCPTAQGLQSVRNIYSDVPQGWHEDEELRQYIEEIDEYMYETVYAEDSPEYVKLHCRNLEPDCSYWSWNGECETSTEFMLGSCAAACMDCSNSSEQSIRCPFDPDEPVVWQKGDLHRMFTRLVTSPDFAVYNPMVASRPVESPNLKFDEVDGPWIVVLDNFLSTEECRKLIKFGVEEGFENPSGEEGKELGRSLATRLCVGHCAQSTVAMAIEERLAQLTGVPVKHQEPIELLSYEDDDYHDLHSDYDPLEFSLSQGPRILTVVLFLNDLTKGIDDTNGGVYFESIETTVRPKLGRAVIFPNVLDEHPMARDRRTQYGVVPMVGGTKYAANIWIHQRDYRAPFAADCT